MKIRVISCMGFAAKISYLCRDPTEILKAGSAIRDHCCEEKAERLVVDDEAISFRQVRLERVPPRSMPQWTLPI
jgi:hypothetical protein